MPTVNSDTKLKVAGDLIKREFDQMYTRTNSTVRNVSGSTTTAVADPVGLPVKLNSGVWEFVLAANIADATGVIVEGPAIAALANNAYTSDEYAILTRGPAVVDKNNLASTDSEGSAITEATFVAALEGETPAIISVDIPSKSSTQTT